MYWSGTGPERSTLGKAPSRRVEMARHAPKSCKKRNTNVPDNKYGTRFCPKLQILYVVMGGGVDIFHLQSKWIQSTHKNHAIYEKWAASRMTSLKYMHFKQEPNGIYLLLRFQYFNWKKCTSTCHANMMPLQFRCHFLLVFGLDGLNLDCRGYELQSLELCHPEDLHQKAEGILKRPWHPASKWNCMFSTWKV